MAFEDYRKTKQKPQRMDVMEWSLLHEIGKALGHLPSVRRDSPEWEAWRGWFHLRGMSTEWADRQPPERLMTVTFPYPPFDIMAEYKKHVKSRGKTLELDE